jgi:hypothetical protein
MWDRLNQQGDFISELARAQSATEANLSALASTVKSGFDQINASLIAHSQEQTEIRKENSRPINWVGLGLALIALLGGMVTFVSLVVAPVKTDVATLKNSDAIQSQELADRAFTLGRLDADMEWIKKEFEKD